MVKISEHVIDYCKRWDVEVEVISSEYFSSLKKDSKFNPAPFNNTGIYSSNNKKIIYVDINDRITQNPTDDKVLHELAHIVMRVTPSFIDEFNSPYFYVWYKMMQDTNSKHRLISDLDGFVLYSKNFFQNKIVEGSLFVPELIQYGLFKETGEFTFNYKKVKPQKSWLKN